MIGSLFLSSMVLAAAQNGAEIAERAVDQNKHIRAKALNQMFYLYETDGAERAALARLKQLFLSSDPAIRARAVTARSYISEEMHLQLTFLKAASHDRDHLVRVAAMESLSAYPISEVPENWRGPVLDLLIQVTKDRASDVRVEAAKTVGSVFGGYSISGEWAEAVAERRAATQALTALLNDPVAKVRLAAISAFEEMADDSASQALRPLLGDPAGNIRAASAQALGVLLDDQSISLLIERLADPQAAVVAAAHRALVMITGLDEHSADPQTWKAIQREGHLAPTVLRHKLSYFRMTNANRRGIEYAFQHFEEVQRDEIASFVVGEMGLSIKDFASAEKGYAAAIRQIESRPTAHGRPINNPFRTQLPPLLRWACYDGLGSSLLGAHEYARSIVVLETALSIANNENHIEGIARAQYNLACCHARLNQFDIARQELRKALALNRNYFETMQSDDDLREAMGRSEFKALLAK